MNPPADASDATTIVPSRQLPQIVAVAAGGVLGAIARWSVGGWLGGRDGLNDSDLLPWDTLFVNVVGCLLIGIAAGRIDRGSTRWSFAVTGVLGGFTTMSAFAVELNDLADAGHSRTLATYLVATMLGSAVAFGVGEWTARGAPSARRGPPDASVGTGDVPA